MKGFLIIKVLLGALAWQIVTSSFTLGQEVYQLKANIKGLLDRTVVIRYTQNGMLLADTVSVHQGKFSHAMTTTDGHIATLLLNSSTQIAIWLDSPTISISGSINPSLMLKCVGSAENELLDLYRNTIVKPYSLRKNGKSSGQVDLITLQEERATRRFIEQYPTTLTAAYLLYWQAIYDTTQFDEIDRLLNKLTPSIQSSYWAKKAATRIYNVRNRPRIGKKVPSFTIQDVTDRWVTLDSFKGKYLLIDFWATWCVPCIEGIPELKEIYSKYGDRLSILSIAWERPENREKWLKMIDKYKMPWPQSADFRTAQEGVTELYNVKEFPTLLVVDPNGNLMGRIKYGQPMERQLRQLLDK